MPSEDDVGAKEASPQAVGAKSEEGSLSLEGKDVYLCSTYYVEGVNILHVGVDHWSR